MRPLDYFKMAVEDIGSAKLRSFLTSLGVIIGVGSVVLMMSIGEGVSSTVTGAFSELGSTRLTVSPSVPRTGSTDDRRGLGSGSQSGGGSSGLGTGNVASTLTVEDAAALASIEGVAASAPAILVAAKVSGPSKTLDLAVTGTTASYEQATGQKLVAGRAFGEGPAEAVLNEAAAKQLFGVTVPAEVVGRTLKINGQDFAVAGVFADVVSPFAQMGGGGNGGQGREGEDQGRPALFVPVRHALGMARTEHVSQIVVAADSPENVESAVTGIETVLVERHNGVRDFRVISFQQLLSSFTQIFGTLTLFLAAIAGISLVVGGIGIMNIMLVTVTERTREIGIAKAIGATRRNIVAQFLTESVLLSLIGGALGLIVAWLGTVLLQQLLDLPAIINLGAISLAMGVSVAIGVFFGVVPAWRAARLDPIVALRHE